MKKASARAQVTSIRLTDEQRTAADRLRKRLGLRSRGAAIKEAIYLALEATR